MLKHNLPFATKSGDESPHSEWVEKRAPGNVALCCPGALGLTRNQPAFLGRLATSRNDWVSSSNWSQGRSQAMAL